LTSDSTQLPTVVIGAGPVGLAGAAQLAERGLPFVVLEAGDSPGSSVRDWAHVRVFSPWDLNIDHAARRLLDASGWTAPDCAERPTGAELIDEYLAPLATVPQIAPHLRFGARVVALGRDGVDRVRTDGRDKRPFVIRLAGGEEILARAVIDASGTWNTPNVLGANGLPAHQEADAVAAGRITGGLPDVLGADRKLFAGQHTVVVGAGHSAANTLLALVQLAEQEPGTRATWAIRAETADRAFGDEKSGDLPARSELGAGLRRLTQSGRIELAAGIRVHALRLSAEDVTVISRGLDGSERTLTAQRVVNATGFRPDHTIAAELRLDLDPVLGCTRELAPLIDPNLHSCGTVPPHGVDELSHPETSYWAVGMKSYGRAPTFLMATGYEQVRSIVSALASDWDAAQRVDLALPGRDLAGERSVGGVRSGRLAAGSLGDGRAPGAIRSSRNRQDAPVASSQGAEDR
jgi:thioredoxin reductase